MALPEPQWPRPRNYRVNHSRPLAAEALGPPSDDDGDEASPRPKLSEHPLGQRPLPQSLFPAALLFGLFCAASLWSWTAGHETDLTATQDLVFHKAQYWRLFTTLLVHADIAHLLANSGLFLIFGLFLRNYFGPWAFPGLSLLGGIGTGALALLTYGPDMRLIGASGLVYFMAALWLVLFLRFADYLSWLHRTMRAIAFTLIVLVPTQFEPQVSYRTHAIGFALGLLLGWMSSPWLRPAAHATPDRGHEEEQESGAQHPDAEEELLP